MPKTAKELMGVYRNGIRSYITDKIRIDAKMLNYKKTAPEIANKLNDIHDILIDLSSNDEADVQNGIDKMQDFSGFLHNSIDGDKTGYDILTEGLNKAKKEDFDDYLRYIEKLFDFDLQLDTIKGYTPLKAPVSKTNILNIEQDIKAKPNNQLIEIEEDNTLSFQMDRDDHKEYYFKDLTKTVEESLHTNAQKNTFRAFLNAFTYTIPGQSGAEADPLKNSFNTTLRKFLNHEIYANEFTYYMTDLANNQISVYMKDKIKPVHLKKAVQYGEMQKSILDPSSKEVKESEKKNTKKLSSKDIQKAKNREEILKKLDEKDIPALNEEQIVKFKTMPKATEDAEGKWRDSDQYKEFEKSVENLADIVRQISDAKGQGKIRISSLNSYNKKQLRTIADQDGMISYEQAVNAYIERYKDAYVNAHIYEKYKFEQRAKDEKELNTKDRGKLLLTSKFTGTSDFNKQVEYAKLDLNKQNQKSM